MRHILILIIGLILSSCRIYQLTTDDLRITFKLDNNSASLACHNNEGKKVWLYLRNAKMEIYKKGDAKPLNIHFSSVKVQRDTLFALQLKGFSQIPIELALKDIANARVLTFFSSTSPFFQPDSVAKVVKLLNDSLDKICNIDTKYSIYLRPIKDWVPYKDSVVLYENACYNFVFSDNIKVHHGVIKRITTDSIYISNSFNANTAKTDKIEYKILRYSLSDISKLKLLTGGGLLFKSITNKQYKFEATPFNIAKSGCGSFYAWDEYTGDIYYYDNWLVERGYVPIKEIKGQIYW